MSASSLSNTKAPGRGRDTEPGTRQMLALWLPLAASISMMVLEPSIINVGLGRTSTPDLALAAFGVAFGLALLVEAPILMLLDASVARSSDREAFGVVRRITLILGLAVTALDSLARSSSISDAAGDRSTARSDRSLQPPASSTVATSEAVDTMDLSSSSSRGSLSSTCLNPHSRSMVKIPGTRSRGCSPGRALAPGPGRPGRRPFPPLLLSRPTHSQRSRLGNVAGTGPLRSLPPVAVQRGLRAGRKRLAHVVRLFGRNDDRLGRTQVRRCAFRLRS